MAEDDWPVSSSWTVRVTVSHLHESVITFCPRFMNAMKALRRHVPCLDAGHGDESAVLCGHERLSHLRRSDGSGMRIGGLVDELAAESPQRTSAF